MPISDTGTNAPSATVRPVEEHEAIGKVIESSRISSGPRTSTLYPGPGKYLPRTRHSLKSCGLA